MNKIFFTFLIMFILVNPLISEESDDKSQKEERLAVIKFGIDTELIDLLGTLGEEEEFSFNKEIFSQLEITANGRLKSSIVQFFTKAEDNIAVEYIFDELKNDYTLSDENSIVYIHYLKLFQTDEISEYFLTLIDNNEITVSAAAIAALAESELSSVPETLLVLLKDEGIDDRKKSALIETLGELEYSDAVPLLTDIVTNEYLENNSLRWKSVVALGRIADPDSLETLKSLFADKDPYLRNYTITALKHFPQKDVEDILVQGLRDSSWRVRVSAAESIGEMQIKDALDILKYKAENDPDIRNVRAASVRAIGEIGGGDAFDFLRKIYLDDHTNMGLRTIAVTELVDKDLSGSIKTIEKVFDAEWDKDSSPVLDYTCKLLSTAQSGSLNKLYERMLSYDKTINLKIYALRGIRLNSISSLRDKVQILAEADNPNSIEKLANDVLDDL